MKRFTRGIFVMAFVLIAVAMAFGQSGPVAPDCTPADLDASFKFMNDTPTDQAVVINFRNVSRHACLLRGGNGVMFNDVRHGHNVWTKDCRNCSPDGKPLYVAPLTLAIGETGYFLLHWKSASVDDGGPCQEAGGFNGNGVLVVAPSLLNDVCSVVRADSYLPGPFVEQHQVGEMGAVPTIKLDSSGPTLYAGDSFSFLFTVSDPNGQIPIDKNSCPVAFIRTRHAGGDTAFEEIALSKCTVTASMGGRGRLVTAEIRAPGLGVLNELGSTNVQLHILAGQPGAQQVAMIASNKLDLNIVDPATVPRTWGPEVKGLAISLALDKENYKIGDDVPLRIAVENFTAAGDIENAECTNHGVAIEVRDSDGKLVTSPGEGVWVCTGHGWPISYPKGKVIPVLQNTLRGLGMLPDHAGTYMVFATWNAFTGTAGPKAAINSNVGLEPYAVVYSTHSTFRVVQADPPPTAPN